MSRRIALPPLLALLCAAALGCSDAKLSNMIPGGNVATGRLDCWLTFEFESPPSGVDPRDVRVRFSSVALVEPAEFDWAYIASHDYLAKSEGAFGSGNTQAQHTTPDGAPPVGEAIKARFPLRAKQEIENAPSPLWLEAELWWGGKKQDSLKRTLEHVYESSPGSFL